MKWAVGVVLFVWLLAGVIGAWMMDDLDRNHLDLIAKGPITLARAYNDQPVQVPMPN